jgi:hypothetical protein
MSTENIDGGKQPYPTDENGSFEVAQPKTSLPKVFAILLAVKTVHQQAPTDGERVELLQSVIQGLLEVLDASGVKPDMQVFGATVLGLSAILADAGDRIGG